MTEQPIQSGLHRADLDGQAAEQHLAAVQQILNRFGEEIGPYLVGQHALVVIEHLISEVGAVVSRLSTIKRDIDTRSIGVPLDQQLARIEAEIRGAALRQWSDRISGQDPDLPERR